MQNEERNEQSVIDNLRDQVAATKDAEAALRVDDGSGTYQGPLVAAKKNLAAAILCGHFTLNIHHVITISGAHEVLAAEVRRLREEIESKERRRDALETALRAEQALRKLREARIAEMEKERGAI